MRKTWKLVPYCKIEPAAPAGPARAPAAGLGRSEPEEGAPSYAGPMPPMQVYLTTR
jgi:hypothetical protein